MIPVPCGIRTRRTAVRPPRITRETRTSVDALETNLTLPEDGANAAGGWSWRATRSIPIVEEDLADGLRFPISHLFLLGGRQSFEHVSGDRHRKIASGHQSSELRG